jgi:hypothetical protein
MKSECTSFVLFFYKIKVFDWAQNRSV